MIIARRASRGAPALSGDRRFGALFILFCGCHTLRTTIKKKRAASTPSSTRVSIVGGDEVKGRQGGRVWLMAMVRRWSRKTPKRNK